MISIRFEMHSGLAQKSSHFQHIASQLWILIFLLNIVCSETVCRQKFTIESWYQIKPKSITSPCLKISLKPALNFFELPLQCIKCFFVKENRLHGSFIKKGLKWNKSNPTPLLNCKCQSRMHSKSTLNVKMLQSFFSVPYYILCVSPAFYPSSIHSTGAMYKTD